jgi:hypothetical protein
MLTGILMMGAESKNPENFSISMLIQGVCSMLWLLTSIAEEFK